MKFLIVSNRVRFAAFLSCALLFCIASFDGFAQTPAPAKAVLPRVGTIKDYPATGLMTGCGNLYFYPASRASGSNPVAYIFIARGDGSNAWMNLGGRDVRLRQIKMTTRGNRKPGPYHYRFGKLRITIVFEAFKPEDTPAEEGDSIKMKITLRKGRAVRIVRAVGGSDC